MGYRRVSCAVSRALLHVKAAELEKASVLETSRALYSLHKTSSFFRRIQGGEGKKNQSSVTGVGRKGGTSDGASLLVHSPPGLETIEG